MEKLVNTMTAISANNRAVPFLGKFLNDITGVAEEHAGLDKVNGGVEAVAGGLNDPDSGGRRSANVVGFIKIAVEAVVIEGYVDVDDIAILEGAAVGDTVANNFVYGGADGFGEVVVVEGGWVRLRG